MKKVLGIIIILMVVIGAICYYSARNDAKAEDGVMYKTDSCTAEEFINNWAAENEKNDWIAQNDVNGVLYGLGGLCKDVWEHNYGKDWSIEAFNEASIEEFDMCEIHTCVVEERNGVYIYEAKAQSETTPLGWKNGEPYYCADVIFVIYSNYGEI